MAGAWDYDDITGRASGAIETVLATPSTPQMIEVLICVLGTAWPACCPFIVLALSLISLSIKVDTLWVIFAPRNAGAGSSWQRLSPCTAGGGGDRLF